MSSFQERQDTVITFPSGMEVRFMGPAGAFIEVENPHWKNQGGRPVGATMEIWLQIAHAIIAKHEQNERENRYDGA